MVLIQMTAIIVLLISGLLEISDTPTLVAPTSIKESPPSIISSDVVHDAVNTADKCELEGERHDENHRSSRASSSDAVHVESPLHDKMKLFIETFRNTLPNMIDHRKMSWQRHYTQLQRDYRSPSQIVRQRELHSNGHVPAEWRAIQAHINILSASRSISDAANDTATRHDCNSSSDSLSTTVLWDSSDDISTYFETLLVECARSATEPSFNEACWGFLYDLVNKPRCTTRLDSRYKCNGSRNEVSLVSLIPRMQPKDLLMNFLGNGTLNVVIIGAGPVGLHLANSLAWMQNNQLLIRIVVFENRTLHVGHKKPYSRDWMTDLKYKRLKDMGDPDLLRYLQVIHDPGHIGIPINTLETLLLLSTRQKGVKFVFEDFQNYRTTLMKVPNLLVFDASGHHLHPLIRSDVSKQASSSTDVDTLESANDYVPQRVPEFQLIPWFRTHRRRTAYYSQEMYKHFLSERALVSVAENHQVRNGNIVYPVSVDGHPYAAHFLKVNSLQLSLPAWNQFTEVRKFTRSNSTDWCFGGEPYKPCPRNVYDSNETCYAWCSNLFTWHNGNYYREDIADRIFDDPAAELTFAMAFFSLTPEQADAFSFLFGKSNKAVSLSHLPLHPMTSLPLFRRNNFHLVLRFFLESNAEASVNLFTYRPYVYTDPVSSLDLFGNRTTVLRIGDSLMSGDPNLSTGLGEHIGMIQRFVHKLDIRLNDST